MNNSHWLTDYDPSNEEFWNKKGKKMRAAHHSHSHLISHIEI